MMLYIKTVLIFFIMALLVSCNNDTSGKAVPKEEPAKENTQIEKQVVNKNPGYIEGKKYFTQYCLACHQQDGMGVPGMNPPLSRTSWVLGDKERLIGVVLKGMGGGTEIDGEIYSNAMASFAMLKDNEIALILSYVRSSFGNDADAVSEMEVAKVRAALK